jgi:hypothetical protein
LYGTKIMPIKAQDTAVDRIMQHPSPRHLQPPWD